MRKNFQGLLSFLLVIILILSLASCGEKKTDVKEAEVKETDVKETDVKETDVKETDVQEAEALDTEKTSITVVDLAGREVALELPLERVIISHWESLEAYSAPVGEKIFDSVVGIGESGGMKDTKMFI